MITYFSGISHSESMTQWSLDSSGHYHSENSDEAAMKTQSYWWHNNKFICIKSADRKGTAIAQMKY